MLRCLIVDDSVDYLSAACRILAVDGVSVVGTAATSAEAVEQARRLRPDVVLVDLHLGHESGFDLAKQLHREVGLAPAQVILISTNDPDEYADLIAASPIAGFLSKADLSASAIVELRAGVD
jgi:DNA-binding NarL/FixJ family response regulator